MAKKSQIINGTLGADSLFGDTSGTLSNTGGAQTINGLAGDDTLYGDAFNMQKRTHGGNDTLNGGDGSDNLFGDAFEMHQNSVGGDDTLNGGSGNIDTLYGDANLMFDSARSGDEIKTVVLPQRLVGDTSTMNGDVSPASMVHACNTHNANATLAPCGRNT